VKWRENNFSVERPWNFFFVGTAHIFFFLGYVNSLLLILCLCSIVYDVYERVRGHNIIIIIFFFYFDPREECHYIHCILYIYIHTHILQGSAHSNINNNKLALHMCTRVRETGFFFVPHTRTNTQTHTHANAHINILYYYYTFIRISLSLSLTVCMCVLLLLLLWWCFGWGGEHAYNIITTAFGRDV